MTTLLKLCGVMILVAAVSLLLGRDKEKKWAVIVCAVFLIILQSLEGISEILLFLREKSHLAGVNGYTEPLLKGLGIGVISLIGSNVCREADAGSAADALEIYAGIQILLLCLPFAEKILRAVEELLTIG